MLLDSHQFSCPWCGDANHVDLEPEEVGQTVVQDCRTCCAPIEIRLPADPREPPIISREGD